MSASSACRIMKMHLKSLSANTELVKFHLASTSVNFKAVVHMTLASEHDELLTKCSLTRKALEDWNLKREKLDHMNDLKLS